MAAVAEMDPIEEIGQTAGLIWHFLSEHGTTSVSRLVTGVEAPRDLVLQGIGWLAREEKIAVERTSRSRTIRLR
ncbi:MAG: winged helix-turn-helix domain-containing protein [Planctomycetaceae bacterium]